MGQNSECLLKIKTYKLKDVSSVWFATSSIIKLTGKYDNNNKTIKNVE